MNAYVKLASLLLIVFLGTMQGTRTFLTRIHSALPCTQQLASHEIYSFKATCVAQQKVIAGVVVILQDTPWCTILSIVMQTRSCMHEQVSNNLITMQSIIAFVQYCSVKLMYAVVISTIVIQGFTAASDTYYCASGLYSSQQHVLFSLFHYTSVLVF